MDWESIGGGGATGFIASVAAFLGWNRRLRSVEDRKQDKAVCEAIHNQVLMTQTQMHSDMIYIKGRLDRIFDMMINGHK